MRFLQRRSHDTNLLLHGTPDTSHTIDTENDECAVFCEIVCCGTESPFASHFYLDPVDAVVVAARLRPFFVCHKRCGLKHLCPITQLISQPEVTKTHCLISHEPSVCVNPNAMLRSMPRFFSCTLVWMHVRCIRGNPDMISYVAWSANARANRDFFEVLSLHRQHELRTKKYCLIES